jgi:site-specific recombinase XerD
MRSVITDRAFLVNALGCGIGFAAWHGRRDHALLLLLLAVQSGLRISELTSLARR